MSFASLTLKWNFQGRIFAIDNGQDLFTSWFTPQSGIYVSVTSVLITLKIQPSLNLSKAQVTLP